MELTHVLWVNPDLRHQIYCEYGEGPCPTSLLFVFYLSHSGF